MSFPEDALTRDAFLGGRITLLQPRRGYRAATDPVFLAAFVPASPGDSVLDLGCGAGAASLCLAARVPGLDLHGLEFQPAYADLARRNASFNKLQLTVHDGDVAALPDLLRQRSFDHVLMNPPYHQPNITPSLDPGRAAAHGERTSLSVWFDAALRRLRPGGTLTVIHRAERLGTVLAMLENRAGAAEVLPLASREGRPAIRVLVRAVKAARSPLVLHPPFTVHRGTYHSGDRSNYSVDAEAVLRGTSPSLLSTR